MVLNVAYFNDCHMKTLKKKWREPSVKLTEWLSQLSGGQVAKQWCMLQLGLLPHFIYKDWTMHYVVLQTDMLNEAHMAEPKSVKLI